MPFIKLQFKPGLNRDQTDYSNEGGWRACDKIRFRSGYPEKIGGWEKTTAASFDGYCRQMWNWVTTYSDDFLALGTNSNVYIEVGGNFYDITPLRATTPTLDTPETDNCISVSSGLAVVTVDLGATAHGALTGDSVDVSGVAGTTIGGIPVSEINGIHTVTRVTDFVFTFATTTSATSSVASTGGTAIVLDFVLRSGYPITTFGYGWGTGTWGRGTWGSSSTSPINYPLRSWWFSNFDNDLVMNIRNGPAFWWVRGTTDDPASALATRAISLQDYATAEGFSSSAVPVKIGQLMVSQQDRHLLAFGAVPFGSTSEADFDPMLIRWADQDTPGDWTPSTTNSAGDIRVSRGSLIVRALSTRQEHLIWTDTHLYTLQFLGTTDVFGLQEYADNVSIMSSRSVISAANVVYWMGQDKFYAYTGRVETLPCTLRNHVFNNINLAQADQIICGTNEQWNEIWWFYPTATSDYNDAYVVYNHLERIWYYGTMARTAWLDTPLRHYPQAANTAGGGTTGYLYSHELGVDDDGSAMTSYIQSSDFDLDDGDNFILTRRVIPDITFDGSTAATPQLTMSLRPRNFPGGAVQSDSFDSQSVVQTAVGQYTDQVFIRARARQMALKVQSENLGVQWQLGAPRLDGRPDGRR
jgi:hypothetical protein